MTDSAPITLRGFLHKAALTREMVDRFLDPSVSNWAVFDGELGYLVKDSVVRDGVDDCYTVARYRPTGERLPINYANRPCRINTYGDSFTMCHQVSDGETWQEYLAAHLGEPIRNFGVGGYGVYQAYRRLLRHEATAASAPYVLLNVWEDDHLRNIYPWRWLHLLRFRQSFASNSYGSVYVFHSNPWAHLRLDLDSGRFEERPSMYPTPQSLYLLCDKEHVYESFRGHWDVHARLAVLGACDVDWQLLRRVADALGVQVDLSSSESGAQAAHTLLCIGGMRASMYTLERAMTFLRSQGKKLMVLLSYGEGTVQSALRGLPRWDQPFVDFVQDTGLLLVDSLDKHCEDYCAFRCTPEEYTRRYYTGHYSPQGNHFFAFAIKDALVQWLEPRPPTYCGEGPVLRELMANLA